MVEDCKSRKGHFLYYVKNISYIEDRRDEDRYRCRGVYQEI